MFHHKVMQVSNDTYNIAKQDKMHGLNSKAQNTLSQDNAWPILLRPD